ncbi:winged helix-turn-helix domain-containing protein [Aestuariimicrobium ganziense]|uniref:winged helix-turn-helix domain-containing protein n=1 Tax=Aestuariimicrobium ganziense TaxID=2773677 RepID=UPI00194276FB|nr:helix-turn-helix domain-containing protein [Aestuariimicrobium ganziense]
MSDVKPGGVEWAPRATADQVKAFSHPLRMRLYSLLGDQGRATASMLARQTGESSGQTSYHLRQLARFGLVEEAEEQGVGRERWWQAVSFSFQTYPDRDHPEVVPGVDLVAAHFIDDTAAAMHRWRVQAADEPDEWRRATSGSTSSAWMTVDELATLTEELTEVLRRNIEAADVRYDAGEHQGRRRVRAIVSTLVLPDSPLATDGNPV